jgi:DNA gyrase inhibitor GyrI
MGIMSIDSGLYATGRFSILSDQFGDAWEYITNTWLAQGDYQFGKGVCYERYYQNPEDHPGGTHEFDIRIPVSAV